MNDFYIGIFIITLMMIIGFYGLYNRINLRNELKKRKIISNRISYDDSKLNHHNKAVYTINTTKEYNVDNIMRFVMTHIDRKVGLTNKDIDRIEFFFDAYSKDTILSFRHIYFINKHNNVKYEILNKTIDFGHMIYTYDNPIY